MARLSRWKARVEFLLSVIELLFLSLTVEALQGKCVKTTARSTVQFALSDSKMSLVL